MKKTEYFLSTLRNHNSASDGLKECIDKRDAFILENKIKEVEQEKADIFQVYSGNYIYVLLTLTYYIKK